MHPIDHYVTISHAKTDLLDLVRRIKDNDSTVAITRNGVPEAVMISLERFNALLESLDIMADPAAMASIRAALTEADTDQLIDAAEVLGDG